MILGAAPLERDGERRVKTEIPPWLELSVSGATGFRGRPFSRDGAGEAADRH